jgi:DNA-binding XRE family transcriptional regulator
MSITATLINHATTIHFPLSAEEVRAFREEHRLSRQGLAALLDVSLRTVEAWEATPGTRPSHAIRLAFAALHAGLMPWTNPHATSEAGEPLTHLLTLMTTDAGRINFHLTKAEVPLFLEAVRNARVTADTSVVTFRGKQYAIDGYHLRTKEQG